MKTIWKFFDLRCERPIEFSVVFVNESSIKLQKMVLEGKISWVALHLGQTT
jgi:hypothetical protein